MLARCARRNQRPLVHVATAMQHLKLIPIVPTPSEDSGEANFDVVDTLMSDDGVAPFGKGLVLAPQYGLAPTAPIDDLAVSNSSFPTLGSSAALEIFVLIGYHL